MTAHVLKSIGGGVLIGAALFFAPFFLLRAFLFILVIGAIFRLFVGRRFRRGWKSDFHPAFADHIRNMSDEEYTAFKQHYGKDCYPERNSKTPETQKD